MICILFSTHLICFHLRFFMYITHLCILFVIFWCFSCYFFTSFWIIHHMWIFYFFFLHCFSYCFTSFCKVLVRCIFISIIVDITIFFTYWIKFFFNCNFKLQSSNFFEISKNFFSIINFVKLYTISLLIDILKRLHTAWIYFIINCLISIYRSLFIFKFKFYVFCNFFVYLCFNSIHSIKNCFLKTAWLLFKVVWIIITHSISPLWYLLLYALQPVILIHFLLYTYLVQMV